MTSLRTHVRLLIAIVVIGLSAAVASAQSGPPPGSASDQAARYKADQQRRFSQANAKLNAALGDIHRAFDARHATDPSQPTYDDAARGAIERRMDHLIQQISGTADRSQARAGLSTMLSTFNGQGPSLSQMSDAQQQQFTATAGTVMFGGAHLANDFIQIFGDLMCDVAQDLSLQIEPPGENNNPTRVLIAAARGQYDYNVSQQRGEITHAQTAYNRNIPEITRRAREEGAFRDSNTHDDLVFGGGREGFGIRINVGNEPGSTPGIDMWDVRGSGEGLARDLAARIGNPVAISDSHRAQGEAFIRGHWPAQAGDYIRRFDREIDRINSAARRRWENGDCPKSISVTHKGASSEQRKRLCGGSPSGRGGGRSVEPTVWDDFLDNGGSLTSPQLLDIYRGYDPFNPTAMALGHAGNSLSSALNSLSLAGSSLSSVGTSPSSVGWSLSSGGNSLSSVGSSLSSAGNSPSSVGSSLSSAGDSLSSAAWTPDLYPPTGVSSAGVPGISSAGASWPVRPSSRPGDALCGR